MWFQVESEVRTKTPQYKAKAANVDEFSTGELLEA
jgi:hypothetical protein